MRKILFALVAILFTACKKEEKAAVPPIPKAVEAPVAHECYQGISNKDTVSMHLELKGNEVVSGKLRYRIFKKDKNDGDLVGFINGDTLLAAYTFLSEGKSSVREVVFLKKGDTYTEGYGEIIDDNKGNVVFKDKKLLKFDNKTVLSKTDCK